MRIIKIEAYENGGHENQTGKFELVPKGYAVIPEDMETPNFPFGNIEVEEIDGVLIITKWIAGTIPQSESLPEQKSEPSATELLNAFLGVTSYE